MWNIKRSKKDFPNWLKRNDFKKKGKRWKSWKLRKRQKIC